MYKNLFRADTSECPKGVRLIQVSLYFKFKIAFPSEVLVLSDLRPFNEELDYLQRFSSRVLRFVIGHDQKYLDQGSAIVVYGPLYHALRVIFWGAIFILF